MKISRWISVYCLLMIPQLNLVNGFSSLAFIRDLVEAEEDVIEFLKKYCHSLQNNIDKLPKTEDSQYEKRFLESKRDWIFEIQRKKIEKLQRKEEILASISHPTGAVGVMTSFAESIKELRKILNLRDVANLTKRLRAQVPVAEDIRRAHIALIRLQITYDIPSNDIYTGNISGHQGRPLDPHEAFTLGRLCVEYGVLHEAVDWLQTAFIDKRPHDTYLDVDIFALMSQAFYMAGYTTKALVYLEKAARLDPRNSNVLKMMKMRIADGNDLFAFYDHTLQGDSADLRFEQYKETCKQDSALLIDHVTRYNVCRYKAAFLPYVLYKEEILHWSPYVSIFYDVVSDDEAELMKDEANPELWLSRTLAGETLDRTSANTFLYDNLHPYLERVSKRIGALTGLNTQQNLEATSSSEPFQIVNYGIGGEYKPHVDADPSLASFGVDDLTYAGDRIATFLMYLSDVEYGGATVFPLLRIKMTPQKKSAIFWYSYPPNDGEILELSEHAGCPVVLGEKWVSNKWIWAYGNSFTRPCGLTPDHTQLRLECEHGNSPFKENCTKLESEYINIMSKLILNERLNATDYVPF